VASPTPTKVDPTAAASAQVAAAVRNYVTVVFRGALANDPRFDYSTVATGTALEGVRNGFTNEYVMGNRYSGKGSVRAIVVESVTLRGQSNSAITTACLNDQTTVRNKKTKKVITKPGGESSWTFTMVRKNSHWLVSQAKGTGSEIGACTRS
jgi:hypothetical protein